MSFPYPIKKKCLINNCWILRYRHNNRRRTME